ncbi:MAG TPA: TolC family outer membrane protein [Stellaceae bacterium]|nr:TolC family outer membrane protein [Stellaceae bacterium]
MPQPRGRERRGWFRWGMIGCLVCIAAGLASAGTPASAQTLTEAFAYAYTNNPLLLAERAKLRAIDEQVPQALSNWRPTVNFTGSAGYSRGGFETPASPSAFGGGVCSNGAAAPVGTDCPTQFSNFIDKQLDLRVTQPIYRGGRTEAQTRQAMNNVQSERAATLGVETQVFQTVARAYLDVVRDQTLVEVARNNEQVLKKQLDATRDRFRVGEVTRTDVAQAESSLAQATAQRINAEGQLEASRAGYTHAVGHPPGRLVMPRERPVLPATRDEALSLAAHDNPTVIESSFAEMSARDNVALVRGQLLPQVSIVGDLSRSYAPSFTLRNSRTDTASISAQVTVPLYEGGAVYSQTRAAEQAVGFQRSQLDDARRTAVQNATASWETLQAARAAIASFGAAVRAAQIALEGTQQEALVGSRTVLDVLIAEQQLFTTQSQLVSAQHDAALQEFNLAAATGRLVAPELKLPVQLYDMDRHYRQVKDKWLGFGGGLKE